MPDLITHTSLALLSNKLVRPIFFKKRIPRIPLFFFLIGNIIPDIFSRAPIIVFPEYTLFFDPYHTILGGILLSYFLVLFFEEPKRKRIFLFMVAGTVFHQLIDLVQKNINGTGYRLFFPLDVDVKFGFIWSEDSLYAIPVLILLVAILYRKQNIKCFAKNVDNE